MIRIIRNFQTKNLKPIGFSFLKLLTISGAFFFSLSSFAEETIMPVSVSPVIKSTPVEQVPLTGSVVSLRTSDISPKEEGYINELLVDEGDEVKKGDPILFLDRKLADIETNRVRAQLNEATARLKESKRQRDEAAELKEKNHIAATSFEALVAEVEINQAVIERLRSELAMQKTVAERHVLYAPFDGVITEKMIEVGQWVDTTSPLYRLTELNPLRIEVPVPQFYFSRVSVGTPVTIRFDALANRKFNAEVTTKVPVSNQTTRTFPVFIRIDNKEKLIVPGMSARVMIDISDDSNAKSIMLPRDAIVQKPDGSKTVWLVSEQEGVNKVRPINVDTGKSYRDNIEIIQGDISEGDQVVVKGNELLQPGQSVNVIEVINKTL